MLTAALAPGAANFPINPVSSVGDCRSASWCFGLFHLNFWWIPCERGLRAGMVGMGVLGRDGGISGDWRPHGDSVLPQVILVVDKVLETQDLDGDGLMTPAELINFPGEFPRHTESREPPAPAPQEPQATGRLAAKSPLRQEIHEALEPQEEAGGQEEARRESLEPMQEAGLQTGVQGDAPGPGGEAREQVEMEGDAPGPIEGAGGQEEAGDHGGEAKELPRETLESKNSPNEFEVHSIQMDNDEI